MKSEAKELKRRLRVLFADDDQTELTAFDRYVKESGLPYDLFMAGSLREAREQLSSGLFDVVVLDFNLGDGTAFDLLEQKPDAPVIVVTGQGNQEIAIDAMKQGVYDYLMKDNKHHYLELLPLSIENAILFYQDQLTKARLSDELQELRAEFKEFAYIVSHDLQAPLRGVHAIAEWIDADYAEQLGPEGKEQLDLLRSRVGRMQLLLEGILKYSRLGRLEESADTLEVKTVVDEIVASWQKPDAALVHIMENLPIVKMPPAKLRLILEQLLQNALEAVDPAKGRIEVGGSQTPEGREFWIADNGAGIAQDQQERIFKMFQTLRPRDEVEKAGVGLTVAQKAAFSCGGNITVASRPGEGAKFTVFIPAGKD